MADIRYEIVETPAGWTVLRNGERGADYLTAEAAFEVAAAQTSIEMRSDHEITIHVGRPRKATEPAETAAR